MVVPAPGRIIKLTLGDLSLNAELNDSPAANELFAALPLEGSINRWGKEIYASLPLVIAPSKFDREVVFSGELAYWPPGSAFCVFWGPTPASRNPEEIRAASKVVPLGRLRIIPMPDLDRIAGGDLIRIERAE